MAYVKNIWEDRVVEYPNRYKDQNENVYTFTRYPGEVTSQGTIPTKEKMDNIENGIEQNDNDIGNLEELNTTEKSNLVGAINEVNTIVGNIIESGTNENGNYIKFADGTMICWKQVNVNVRIYVPFGSMYETENRVEFGNYAIPFISTPLIFGNCVNRLALLEAMQHSTETSFGATWLMRPDADAAAGDYTVNLFAIGRWK